MALPKTILIVDDSPAILDMLVYNLSDCRPADQIITADNLEDAKAIIAQQPVDLMVLDIRMGAGDGMDLWQELESSDRRLATIIITGCHSDHASAQLAERKGLKVFYKPFNLDEVIEHICNVLE